MLTKFKLLLTTAIALTALTAVVGTAHAAESASFGPGGAITSRSLGKLTFASGSNRIECELTLRGTLSSFLSVLVEGLLIGGITEVSINNGGCSGGSVETVLGLTWRIVAVSLVRTEAGGRKVNIEGANPQYKKIRILGVAFNLKTFAGLVQCLYEGNAEGWLEMIENGGAKSWRSGLIISDATVTQSFIRGTAGCPRTGSMEGTFGLERPQAIIKL